MLVVLLALSGCEQGNPQQNSSTASDTVTTSPKIKEEDTDIVKVAYATTSLDIAAIQLPPNYEGHDPEDFFNNAFAVREQFKKGEFENTKQFQKRVDSFQSPPFIKALNNNGEFAFRVVPRRLVYNADLEEFSIRIDAKSCSLEEYGAGEYRSYYDENEQVIVIKYLKARESWQDPMVLGIILGDVLQRPKELKQDLTFKELKLHIPIKKAEGVKEKINLLIILKPKIPYTEYTNCSRRPPHILSKLIVGDVVGAWWYNYETGEIYKKLIP